MNDTRWTIIGGLGNVAYRPVRYRFRDDDVVGRTPLGAIARAAGMQGRIDRAIVVASDEAFVANGAALRDDLAGLSAPTDEPGFRRVLVDFHHANAAALVERVREELGEPQAVLLDVTGGPRQLPLLLRASLRLLAAERDVLPIETWFAQVGATSDEPGQIFELGAVDLIERLTSAHREFRRYGRADELAAIFEDLFEERLQVAKERGTLEEDKPSAIRSVSKAIRATSDAIVNALPLDAAALDLGGTVDRHRDRIDGIAPLARSLLDRIRRDLARVARGTRRADFTLNHAEIEREVDMIEAALDRRDAGGASRLLAECMVNRVLLARGRTDPRQWLDFRSEREPAARTFQRLAPEHPLRDLHDEVALFIRNGYAHGGYRHVKLDPARDLARLRTRLAEFRSLLDDPVWDDCVVPEGRGTLGVTPLGLSPGVLWTFLERNDTEFDALLIVTSAQAHAAGETMLARCRVPPARVEWVCFDDPFEAPLRFDPEGALASSGARLDEILVAAADLVVNSAGGTTALHLAVDRIEMRATRTFERHARRCVVVDRRHAAGRPSDPFNDGELIWIDTTR